jgi:ubiquitin thioesterase OTU1
MAIRLQVKHKSGQERLSLEADATLGALVNILTEKTGVPANRLRLKCGFPPKPLNGAAASALVNTVFKSGESLILEEGDEPSVLIEAGSPEEAAAVPAVSAAVRAKRPPAPQAAPPANTSGVAVRRVVDADNSCLFTSLGYVMLGKERAKGRVLRDVVADEILADSETYSEAILGMAPKAYCEWIKGNDHWGGGIELAVLSDHFSAVIIAWDVQTMRADRYGEGRGYKQCVHLIYDGIHYDALALSILEDVPPDSEDFDVTVFSPEDGYMEGQAKNVVKKLQDAKLYTDTGKFSLRCLVCQKGLVGEADAVEHAKATGHQNFAEYK